MNAKTFAILSALLLFMLIVNRIREQKMTFKFSLVWLVFSASVVFFAVFDGLLAHLAKLAGFELPSNFIFFLFLVLSVLINLSLTLYINEQTTRTESLTQDQGILRLKIEQLQKKLDDLKR